MVQGCQPLSRVISFDGRGTQYGRRQKSDTGSDYKSVSELINFQAASPQPIAASVQHGLVWFGGNHQYWKERNCSWPSTISLCTAVSPNIIWYGAFSFHRQHCSGAIPEIILTAGADLTVRGISKYWTIGQHNWKICLLKYHEGWKWEIQVENHEKMKWGLGGGWSEDWADDMNDRLQQHWEKCGNSKLVSERTEICMNSISIHSALSIAKWLCWKASKSNFPVLRVLCTQPTSSSKWVGEPD